MLAAGFYEWSVGVGVPLALALIGWLVKRNDKQHAEGQAAAERRQTEIVQAIGEVREDVKTIDKRLDQHIEWHMGVPPKKGAA